MPASLTATRNPVGVWGDAGTGATTIAWDTDSAQRGRVFIRIDTPPNVQVNETLFAGNPTAGDRTGSAPLSVKAGSIYTLVLRQVSNNAVLATLVVTVVDLVQQAAEQAAAAAALFERLNPSQAIHNLRIRAGTDNVRVTFKTVQPTIPVVRVLRLDGTEVDAAFPLFAGMQTAHQFVLGQTSPLDQATEFEVRIIASGRTRFGQTRDVTASHRFTTGSRPVTVFFTEIDMWQDGDPGGDGEFTFTFGAGDADLRTNLGEPWPASWERDVDDDGPPIFFNSKIDIPQGPRNLWVQAVGTEDDGDIFSGIYYLGRKPSFEGGGSDYVDTGDEYQTWVEGIFDIRDAPYGTTLPLELVTGNFGVAFTVRGSISIYTQPGKSPFIFQFSKKEIGVFDGIGKLLAAGDSGSLPSGQPGGGADSQGGKRIARGADGATYRQVQNAARKLRRDEGWALAAPAVEGPVTALALGPDRIALFTLDAEGAVLHAEVAGKARPGKWRKLGGRFTGAVTALVLANSVELLALDDAGALFHLTLPLKGSKPESDWRRIAEDLSGEFKPVVLGKDAFAVFALSARGAVMHRIHRGGRWRKEGWQVIAGATGVQLGAAAVGADAMGVALAVIDEDMALKTLVWRDYPEKPPKRWVAEGDLQAWLVRPVKPPRQFEPKPAVAAGAARSMVSPGRRAIDRRRLDPVEGGVGRRTK
jgi:hypothetical protein